MGDVQVVVWRDLAPKLPTPLGNQVVEVTGRVSKRD